MSTRPTSIQPLVSSVLDRLIDDQSHSQVEPKVASAQLLRDLKQSVRRDLEDLLNTRWHYVVWPESLQEIEDSLINYGIPDFTASDVDAAQNPDELLHAIESCIQRFEPRLRQVRVHALDAVDDAKRSFRFRIDAVLFVEPLEDPVRFDSALETSTGNVRIEGAGK